MSILEEVRNKILSLDIPVETGKFDGKAPDTYIVLIPLSDTYELSADDMPEYDYQELRIALFTKGNYIKTKNKIANSLLTDFYVTDRKYNGYDTDTGYYQYTIDVAKQYEIKEEN